MDKLQHLVTDQTGLIHLIFSIVSLAAGTCVLIMKKGTKRHKQVGYLYALSMVVMLVTAYMMYHLYGKFGIFHWAAVVSSITLFGGMIPILFRRPATSYMDLHWNFMFWSVFGLYGAFAAELLVRLPSIVIEDGTPNSIFYNLIGVAVFLTFGIGYFIFFKKRRQWSSIEPNK